MSTKENIRAILESIFSGFKEELIDIATKNICDLKQETKTESCEDCISRQAVLDELKEITRYGILGISAQSDGVWYKADEVEKMLKNIPSVNPQEPTITSTNINGEMIYPQVGGITPTVINEDIYQCSCGYGWDKNKVIRFHFCPNCGKAVDNDYKYIKNISNPTGIEFDIDIPKEVENYKKLLKHPVIKHIMDMDEEQEQIDFVRPHKRIPVTLTVEGDCISRAEALRQTKEWRDGEFLRVANPYYYLEKRLNDLPSVTQEPQTGHWKRISIDKYSEHAKYWYRCDRCGKDNLGNTDFCPSCGARMIEKQESEDKE